MDPRTYAALVSSSPSVEQKGPQGQDGVIFVGGQNDGRCLFPPLNYVNGVKEAG